MDTETGGIDRKAPFMVNSCRRGPRYNRSYEDEPGVIEQLRGTRLFSVQVPPLRPRGRPIPRRGVQVPMLDRLHHRVSRPEAIIHAQSRQARGARYPADQQQRDQYDGP
jgi:hypothetical protein